MADIVERLRVSSFAIGWEAADEIERLRAESEAAGKLADSLSDEIERLKRTIANKDTNIGDLQQILLDERAHTEALETEIGEYRAEIEWLRASLHKAQYERDYYRGLYINSPDAKIDSEKPLDPGPATAPPAGQ